MRRPAKPNIDPQRRLLLFGASNLTRGLATLAGIARRAWNEPLDILAAPGNGRSYGLTTNIVGRVLPGINGCGIWRSWHARHALPTVAVVTDVGNDVMYGVPVEQILEWVAAVVKKLRDRDVEVVVTGLPMDAVRSLGPRRYLMLRSVLFPGNRDSFSDALRRSEEVEAGVRRLVEAHGAKFVAPRAEWYGFDPIHVRRAVWGRAWSEIVSALQPPTSAQPVGVAPWSWVRSQFWQPEERRLFGIDQRRAQPSVRFSDGSRLSLY